MKSKSVAPILLALIIVLLLNACAAPDTAQPTADGDGVRVTIGFTVSKTGSLNVESTRQTNGLNLWLKQVNDAGGIRLKDGTVVSFDAKYYDDQSSKGSVQQLYTRLATKDNATFLISPYSSGLTDAAAVIAEQYGKIMITTGAASDSTYREGIQPGLSGIHPGQQISDRRSRSAEIHRHLCKEDRDPARERQVFDGCLQRGQRLRGGSGL